MKKGAVIDDKYRYSLTREWDMTKPKVAFVMLNPSTADEESNDMTTDRCEGFAKRWGYGAIEIVNLFAFRAKDPKELRVLTVEETIGPENHIHLERAIQQAERVVVAWGEHGVLHNCCKDPYFLMLLHDYKEKTFCFGHTSNYQPLHPLHLAYITPLQLFMNNKS
ncbi:DUF1643 domain-containing protein [Bacillus toyonensis]|uniref:DUF1643 domain-containing protein n=1 Tax=Bacillus toyonensis TaxID=155322 RepID=A0A2C4QE62_9BACI|nr:DUF1643 domain-containing protein [Bacillus toyonensis]PGB02044.1 hypothetical protein COL93_13545 [Bacillus toyonensis]PHD63347.1 hypothetical protein COF40_25290 [Bacillus toyonensis]